MNENYPTGHIEEMLTSEGLEMQEAMRSHYPNQPVPPTFMCGDRPGSHAVDGCHIAPDVVVYEAAWPAVYKCPDHKMPIVEIDFLDCLGERVHRMA
jgi:hypothetical protein